MPDKPVKYGMKLFILCDSTSVSVTSLMFMLAVMKGKL